MSDLLLSQRIASQYKSNTAFSVNDVRKDEFFFFIPEVFITRRRIDTLLNTIDVLGTT